jgi:hypothetical protein
MELFRPSASWIPPISEFGMVLYNMHAMARQYQDQAMCQNYTLCHLNNFEFWLRSSIPAL